jgi:hypothetical protein
VLLGKGIERIVTEERVIEEYYWGKGYRGVLLGKGAERSVTGKRVIEECY